MLASGYIMKTTQRGNEATTVPIQGCVLWRQPLSKYMDKRRILTSKAAFPELRQTPWLVQDWDRRVNKTQLMKIEENMTKWLQNKTGNTKDDNSNRAVCFHIIIIGVVDFLALIRSRPGFWCPTESHFRVHTDVLLLSVSNCSAEAETLRPLQKKDWRSLSWSHYLLPHSVRPN